MPEASHSFDMWCRTVWFLGDVSICREQIDSSKCSYLPTRIHGTIHCVRKRLYFFFNLFFFPRCPVCGEWCKLHWLLLDTPSFDWNPRRSRGHIMFKMAPTKQQKAFCAVEYAKTTSGALPLHRQRKDNARCFCLCIGNLSPWVVYANA